MEVIRNQPEFEPVTLVISSKEELDILFAALNSSSVELKISSEALRNYSLDGIPFAVRMQNSVSYAMWKAVESLYTEGEFK